MEMFLIYTLKSSVCFALAYLLYRLLLGKETWFRFRRGIILGSMGLSVILPLIRITFYETVSVLSGTIAATEGSASTVVMHPDGTSIFNILLGIVYGCGVVISLTGSLASIFSVLRIVRRGEKCRMDDGTILVRSRDVKTPFNWMNFIVLPQDGTEYIRSGILSHERAHRSLRHSWDILLSQLFLAWQWFNPAAYLSGRELKILHEFEADEKVLQSGIDAKQYQFLLVKKVMGFDGQRIANGLNRQAIKKRIAMMSTEKTPKRNAWKSLYLLPFIGISLMAFAETETKYVVVGGEVGENGMEQPIRAVKEDSLSEIQPVPEKVSSNEGSGLSGKDGKVALVEVESEPDVDVDDVSEIEPEIYVDGRRVSKAEFEKMKPEDIENIQIDKGKDVQVIRVKTQSQGNGSDNMTEIYLDNQRISKAEFEKIDPEDIESIRVDKAGKKIEVMLLPRGKTREKEEDKPVKVMSYKMSTKKGSPTITIENGWEDNMSFVAGDGMKVTVAPTSKQGNNNVSVLGTDSKVRYYIGDKEASEEEVSRLSSDKIKNIRVSKEEGEPVVYLELKKDSRKSHRGADSRR